MRAEGEVGRRPAPGRPPTRRRAERCPSSSRAASGGKDSAGLPQHGSERRDRAPPGRLGRRLDQRVWRRHLAPELGLDGAERERGRHHARARPPRGCASRYGSSSSPSRAGRRSRADDDAPRGCHGRRSTISCQRRGSRCPRPSRSRPRGPSARRHLRPNPMHLQQFCKLGPARRLPLTVASRRHRDVDHPPVLLAQQPQRPPADDHFIVRVRREDQRDRRIIGERLAVGSPETRRAGMPRLRGSASIFDVLRRRDSSRCRREFVHALRLVAGKLAAAIAWPWRLFFSSGMWNDSRSASSGKSAREHLPRALQHEIAAAARSSRGRERARAAWDRTGVVREAVAEIRTERPVDARSRAGRLAPSAPAPASSCSGSGISFGNESPALGTSRPTACCEKYCTPQPTSFDHSSAGASGLIVDRRERQLVQPRSDVALRRDVAGGLARAQRDAEHGVVAERHRPGQRGDFAVVDDLEGDAVPRAP